MEFGLSIPWVPRPRPAQRQKGANSQWKENSAAWNFVGQELGPPRGMQRRNTPVWVHPVVCLECWQKLGTKGGTTAATFLARSSPSYYECPLEHIILLCVNPHYNDVSSSVWQIQKTGASNFRSSQRKSVVEVTVTDD